MIPDFTSEGYLPPGIHPASWDYFIKRFGNTPHRNKLIDGLRRASLALSRAGGRSIYIDGSFVTDKAAPNDYDAAWDTTQVDLVRLRLIEPLFFNFDNKRAAQKAKYLGEFFPSSFPAIPGGATFLEFFQQDRMGIPKGIVKLDIGKFTP